MKTFLLFTILYLLFLFYGYWVLDPDLGWHMVAGEYILKNGIPDNDPFSYSMPSYVFIDHEWVTNVFFYISYSAVGKVGLSILFAFLAVIAIWLRVRRVEGWYLPFIGVAGLSLLPYVGVRPQLLTWVFFSILLFLLSKKSRVGFFIPILMALWVNLHGGFAVGIAVLFVWFLAQSIEKKKVDKKALGILVVSIFATFLNPYGGRIWQEVFMQMSDTGLRWAIAEWMPAVFFRNFTLWIYATFSVFFVVRHWKKLSLFEQLMYGLLFLAGFSSSRHVPLWILFSLPLTYKALEDFVESVKRKKFALSRLKTSYRVVVVIMVLFSVIHVTAYLKRAYYYQEKYEYPVGAVEYLQKNQYSGNLFAEYEWGGYLLWKLPEKKVFIDGRMPSWRRERAPEGESANAYEEYRRVLAGRLPIHLFAEKYHIDTMLLKKDDNEKLREQLKTPQWGKVYEDDGSVVYKAN